VNSRRWVVLGAVALASVGSAAGCGNGGGTTSGGTPSTAPTSASTDAKQDLVAAADALNSTPFHLDIKSQSFNGQGDADPVNKNSQMTVDVQQAGGTTALKMDLRNVGDQMWIKMDLSGMNLPGTQDMSNKWLHLDTTKMGPNSKAGLASGTGPVDAGKSLDTAKDVQKVDATHYKGTIDLTQGKSLAIDEKTVTTLADKAKAVPFEATVDDQHRLTEFKITVPAVDNQPEQVIDTTYSAFGTAVSVAAPSAAEVAEAPAALYALFKA
jgi:hypothetical protein